MLDRPIHRDQSAWTEDRTELLTKLWTEGKSASECATILGVTRNSVIGKVTRLKLPSHIVVSRPPDTAATVAAIRHAATIRVAEYTPIRPAAWEPLGDAKPISLMDLPNRPGIRCRWPVTGGYCGIKSGTKTYCEDHQRMAYKNEPGRIRV